MVRWMCSCVSVCFNQEFLVDWRVRCDWVTEGVVDGLLFLMDFQVSIATATVNANVWIYWQLDETVSCFLRIWLCVRICQLSHEVHIRGYVAASKLC